MHGQTRAYQHIKTEKSMDVLDAHKSKAKISITCIGTIMSILDFLSLYQHGLTTAITTTDSPSLIL
jgi:hypothetical protein